MKMKLKIETKNCLLFLKASGRNFLHFPRKVKDESSMPDPDRLPCN